MGAKHAGIHLRCDDSSAILPALKRAFGAKKKAPSKREAAAMELILSLARKNLAKTVDPAERARKSMAFEQLMASAQMDMATDAPATIVIREHFVSVYWYDHIRAENLSEELLEYAALCGVPAMGVSIYDDADFSLCAVRNAGLPDVCQCSGAYLFDHGDITPTTAEAVCDTINAPFLLSALKKALSCDTGERMAAVFEAETGLPLFLDEAACGKRGMTVLHRWGNAVVFRAIA